MIDLYYWPTPNGHKITMFLEEAGLEYQIVPVDIARGEQFKPDFLAISPNNRMPAIVDQAPLGGVQSQDLSLFPALSRWFAEIAARPGTVRAYTRAEGFRSAPVVTEESRKILFGQSANIAR